MVLAACATNEPTVGPKNVKDIISADELAMGSYTTAYDAVRSLRPWWLQRADGRAHGPAIFSDDERLPGGYFGLRRVTIEKVHELRFYTTDHAAVKWGPSLEDRSGVIQIVSRQELPPSLMKLTIAECRLEIGDSRSPRA